MNQILFTDYDALFERFAIMTVDGGLTDNDALQYCIAHTSPELAEQLKKNIAKYSTIGDPKMIQEQNFAEQLKQEVSPTSTPATIPAPAPVQEQHFADFKQLEQYIDAGFELFPCIQCTDENGKVKYLPIRPQTGKIALYDSEEQKQAKERHGITDKAVVKEFCSKERKIADTRGVEHEIELFRIFPADNKYLVIDIDTHKDKANGLMQWKTYIKKNNLSKYYADLKDFPCYVESPNGGLHLYFKVPYSMPKKIKDLDSSIEVSTADHGENAGGSYRKGSKTNYYILHGSLQDAPTLPYCIYKDIQPPEPVKPVIMPYTVTQPPAGSKAKWNTTTGGIVQKAREQHGNESPHWFAYWICKYFSEAIKDGINFTRYDVESVLFSLPELANHDRNDTKGVIDSFIGR